MSTEEIDQIPRAGGTAAAIVYALAGAPPQDGCKLLPDHARCWLCGGAAVRGLRRGAWMGALFVGQNRVRDIRAEHVCEACIYVCARLSPVPGRPPKEGKKLGGNFRNYSHSGELSDGRWTWTTYSKGEKPALLAWLRREKHKAWFCGIADSGQKHLLPWVPVNPSPQGSLALFEERRMRLGDFALVEDMTALLTAGAMKEEALTGDYGVRTWMRASGAIRAFEARHRGERGGAWFALAHFLAQRKEEIHDADDDIIVPA